MYGMKYSGQSNRFRNVATVAWMHLFLSVVVAAGWVSAQNRSGGTAAPIRAVLDSIPLHFVENRGVFPEEVRYYIQGADKSLFFTKEGVTFALAGWTVKLDFLDTDGAPEPVGLDFRKAVFSHFRGREAEWHTGLRSFSRMEYAGIWPGIDLVYRGTVNRLKYAFHILPGADPARIRLRYRGAANVMVTPTGALRVETPAGAFEDAPPVAYQEVDGEQVPVKAAYDLAAEDGKGFEVSFRIGAHDPTRPLILDPAVLIYCGYVGGAVGRSNNEDIEGVAVDAAGNLYVCGQTCSTEATFPVKVGPDLTYNGGIPDPQLGDAFVAKVNAAGTGLDYCGYIGGTGADWALSIAVDAAGNAYVCGRTTSTEATFPVKAGPDLTYNGSSHTFLGDAFVAKVNAAGTGLDYCGYIGGNNPDGAYGIAVDGQGNAYVAGFTMSTEATFPVRVGPDLTYNDRGIQDGFVAKVNPAGTALIYCGYIGGSQQDWVNEIAVDASGNAYLAGATWSSEQTFPVKGGPDLTFNGGKTDAFLAKVDAAGAALVYCGYIGGNLTDVAYNVAIDASGDAYVVGTTESSEATFPVKVGPDLTYNGGTYDAFVARVNAPGSGLVFCGYIGGTGRDHGAGIALDPAGNIFVCGSAGSSQASFPVLKGPHPVFKGGMGDAYVARLHPTGATLDYCGYIGGTDYEAAFDIAVDASGNAYLGGSVWFQSSRFPAVTGPDLTYNGGASDAFVAKVAFTDLQGSGAPRPGGAVALHLEASDSPGLAVQFGSSFGTGPIPIDTRVLGLSPDALFSLSVTGLWPWIFTGYSGRVDPSGKALAVIRIPSIPGLVGVLIHSAGVTLDPGAPSGVKAISNTLSFLISP